MAKLKIKFHPLFWVFIIILLFSNNFLSLFSYVLCVFLHELGHALCAGHFGYKLNQITFMPFGASLSGKENVFYSKKHEILVAISGPIVNLILMVLCLAFFWLFPVSYFYLEDFYYANLTTFFFNFFPVYPLDGGRVLYAILKTKFSFKKSYKIQKIVGINFSSFLFILFLISSFFKINFTLGITSIFLFVGIFFEDNSSYYCVNFNFTNKSKKLISGLDTCIISVSEDATLYFVLRKLNKFKYNMVNVIFNNSKSIFLSEEKLNEMFLNYPLSLRLSEIIKLENQKITQLKI